MATTSSRDRLIDVADGLFYREGFHAVGLDRILRLVGVTKTTFYNHFESKDHLILEVLRHHDRWWRQTFMSLLRARGGDDPRSQLLNLPAILHELLSSGVYNGCMFINVAVQFPQPHDPAHQMAAEHMQEMEMILRDLGLRAGASDPVALAEELSMAMQGAYVTQQVTCDSGVIVTFQRLVSMIVEKYVPVPAHPV